MTLEEFCNFFEEELGVKIYPIQFPYANADEGCLVIDIVGGKSGVIDTASIQFMSRSSHPKTAQDLLQTVINKLDNLTNRVSQGSQIILITADVTNPYFVGQDETNKFLYTARFRVLTSKN